MAKIPTGKANKVRLIKFNVPDIVDRGRVALRTALDIVSTEMQKQIRKSISIPVVSIRLPPKPPRKLGRKVTIRSKPGQPPRKETGNLHDTFFVVRDGLNLVVRTKQYGIWLEGGTGRIAMRPFIRRVIDQKKWIKQVNSLTNAFVKNK